MSGPAMDERVAWAYEVVAKGWPHKSRPIEARREAYEELAAAYGLLAAQAAHDGDVDSYLGCSELSEHADQLARECSGPDEVRRW